MKRLLKVGGALSSLIMMTTLILGLEVSAESEDSLTISSDTVTRSHSAFLLGEHFKLKKTDEVIFKDVLKTDRSYSYLSTLVQKGVFVKAENFNPNASLTKGQAAKIIALAFDFKGKSESMYDNITTKSWEHPYVSALIANDVLTVENNERFNSNEAITEKEFQLYFSKAKKVLSESSVKTVRVNSKKEMKALLDEVYTDLPDKVKIESNRNQETLRSWESEWSSETHPKDIINKSTLANYSFKETKGSLYLVDISNDEMSAREVENQLLEFVEDWAKDKQELTEIEKLEAVYNYTFERYEYSATNYKEMLVGNMWNDTLACNGFSRLAYEMFEALDMEAEIIFGDSHIWNTVTVNGTQVLFDVTSDVFLNDKHLTLGLSTSEHKSALSRINIYDGNYDTSLYFSSDNKENILKDILSVEQ